MAEINIQRKERSVWPWLLAGVLLLGLLWYLFARNTNEGIASGVTDSTALRDSGAAAGTLAPADSGLVRDTLMNPPPR